MEESTMIELKRASLSVWEQVNPVLGEGEIGVVSQTSPVQLKVGDGVKTWNQLTMHYLPLQDVGGSNENIILTYEEAFNLADEDKLIPGASYTIVDYEATGYSTLILTAAASSLFYQNGYASAAVPKHRHGTHFIGGERVVFLGVWDSELSLSTGNACACIWYNRVFINLTGNIGSADGFLLDSTNWKLIDPITYREFYRFDLHTVIYDFKNNYVRKEADEFGNEFGEDVLQSDGFLSRYNDFGLDIDGGEFVGNKLSRCYNNSSQIGEIVYNTGGGKLYGNKGLSANGAISYNTIHIGAELKNCTIVGTARINGNNIRGALYDAFCKKDVIGCVVNASVGNFRDYKNEGYPIHCVFDKDLDGGGTSIYASEDPEPFSVNLTKGHIFASWYVGEGEYSLYPGRSLLLPVTNGCLMHTLSNGIIPPVTEDAEGGTFVINFPGKYLVHYESSAICDKECVVTTFLQNAGYKKQEVCTKTQYTPGTWVNTSMSNVVELNKMDTMSFGYDLSGMDVANFTLGQINVVITYLG